MASETPSTRDDGRLSQARRGARYVSGLKIPVALFCLFGIGIAGYYFIYVKQQTQYVAGRNFRVLTTVGNQLEGSITGARTAIRSFLNDPDVFNKIDLPDDQKKMRPCENPQPYFRKIAPDYVPILRSIQIDRWSCESSGTTRPLLRLVEGTQAAWVIKQRAAAPEQVSVPVSLNLADVVTPLLSGETIKDLFASLALTTSTGRVIAQTGDSPLRVADFGQLPLRIAGSKETTKFASISGSPIVAEVELAGSTYVLFVQPCCLNMIAENDKTAAGDKAVGPNKAVAGDKPGPDSGWVLSALVPAGEMQRAGQAFPTSVVLALSIALLLAVFGWPFLKLVLIGEHERVRIYDVLLVAVCSLLGLSLLTLGTLDFYAYQKLTVALDGQLETLADDIIEQADMEVHSAYRQLAELEKHTREHPDLGTRVTGLAADADAATLLNEYPYFSSFALIRDGQQYAKWTFASFLTPMVRVADRDYLTYWGVERPAGNFYLDSIRSRTTGLGEAILSKPFEDGSVSALTIPLKTLLDPVLVPGFGFALIDDSGRVLFHSDSEHNLSESFFAETDGSRRLRALVAARHAEHLDLQYWGEDHRAFLKPVKIKGLDAEWSLVTFYDKQLIRTVNMEGIISATFYTLVYCGVFVCMVLGLLMFRPSYRVPWLWPDAEHAGIYLRLLLSHAALAMAFAVAILRFSPGGLLLTSWVLPLFVWCLTSFVLRPNGKTSARFTFPAAVSVVLALVLLYVAGASRAAVAFDVLLIAGCAWAFRVAWRSRRESMRLAPPLNLSYGLATAGFVLLIAIMPAVGFFNVAHGIHAQNLIKYGELMFARDLSEREERDEADDSRQIKEGLQTLNNARKVWQHNHPDVGAYHHFFFGTSLLNKDEALAKCAVGRSATDSESLPGFLEELLPYYSESSVSLRELMHGGAADDRWNWSVQGGQLRLCVGGGTVDGKPVAPTKALTSTLVPLFGPGIPADTGLTVLLFAGALVVAAAAFFVIGFIMRRIFVVEVIEPLWSGRPVRAGAAPPALLVLSQAQAAARFVQPSQYHLVDLEQAGAGNEAQRAWFDQQLAQIETMPDELNVLILRFDHDLTDEVFNEYKLSFVERLVTKEARTVAILSAVDPEVLFSSAASDGVSGTERSPAQRWSALKSAAGLLANRRVPARSPRTGAQPKLDWRPAGVSELLWRLNAIRFSREASFLEYERRDPFIESQWNQVLPFAWQTDVRPPLDLEQLLIEMDERSENYYQAFWESCSSEERVVLGQVATERLVNEKSSQTVRSLMAKGLIERRPYFDVMNETFRRFVLTRPTDDDVTQLRSQHGAWENVRWPFLLLVGATAAVFFGTQRELFQQTIGIVTAVAATLPTLIKAVSLVGGKSGGTGGS